MRLRRWQIVVVLAAPSGYHAEQPLRRPYWTRWGARLMASMLPVIVPGVEHVVRRLADV